MALRHRGCSDTPWHKIDSQEQIGVAPHHGKLAEHLFQKSGRPEGRPVIREYASFFDPTCGPELHRASLATMTAFGTASTAIAMPEKMSVAQMPGVQNPATAWE
jgi:hypothetical protein